MLTNITLTDSKQFNKEKLGNLIIYLTDEIKKKYKQDLYLTKLLKLLFIIDEKAVEETGVPVTWEEYAVWTNGPVAKYVWRNLQSNGSDDLSFYAESRKDSVGYKIKSSNTFNDLYFSEYEMELFDKVINEYGKHNAEVLIEMLHKEESLWSKMVKRFGIDFSANNTSGYTINFAEKIENDKLKLSIYHSSIESLNI